MVEESNRTINARRQVTMASILLLQREDPNQLINHLHKAGYLHLYSQLSPKCHNLPPQVVISMLDKMHKDKDNRIPTRKESLNYNPTNNKVVPELMGEGNNDKRKKLETKRSLTKLSGTKMLNNLLTFKPNINSNIISTKDRLKVENRRTDDTVRSSVHFSFEEVKNKLNKYQNFDEVINNGISDLRGNPLAYTVKIHLTPSLLSS